MWKDAVIESKVDQHSCVWGGSVGVWGCGGVGGVCQFTVEGAWTKVSNSFMVPVDLGEKKQKGSELEKYKVLSQSRATYFQGFSLFLP